MTIQSATAHAENKFIIQLLSESWQLIKEYAPIWFTTTALLSGLAALNVRAPALVVAFMIIPALVNLFREFRAGTKHLEQFLQGNPSQRRKFIEKLLFATLAILLNTPLLKTLYTKLDLFGLVQWLSPVEIFVTNVSASFLIALFAVLVFHALYRGFEKLYGDWEAVPLHISSFTLAIVPFSISMLPVIWLGETGAINYFVIAFFPCCIAFIAMLGYTHHGNKVDIFGARVLIAAGVGFMFIGFLCVIYALIEIDAGRMLAQNMPVSWRSLARSFNITSIAMEVPADFSLAARIGNTWTILTGAIYEVMIVGPATIFILYGFQYQPAKRQARLKELLGAILSEKHKTVLLKHMLGEWPTRDQVDGDELREAWDELVRLDLLPPEHRETHQK